MRSILLFLLIATVATELVPKMLHRECTCAVDNIWLDIVFVIDTSRAVSHQDFIAIGSLLSHLVDDMAIDQTPGQYARVGLIFGAEKPYVAANLTTFVDAYQAAQRIKALVRNRKKLPVGKGMRFNVGSALTEARLLLNKEGRVNRPSVVVLFTATEVTCHRSQHSGRGRYMRFDLEDPCRIGTRLTEENNVLLTVGLKFGGLQRFPKLEIATPCFNLTNSATLPQDLLKKICEANCFCPRPYVQFKNDQTCQRYAECVYMQGISLPYISASSTCNEEGGQLVDIFTEEKGLFIKRLHDKGNHYPYWIGLDFLNGAGFWQTGKQLEKGDFESWAPKEPSKKGKCTEVKAGKGDTSLWSSQDCHETASNFFSCQKHACDTSNYCAITPEENSEISKEEEENQHEKGSEETEEDEEEEQEGDEEEGKRGDKEQEKGKDEEQEQERGEREKESGEEEE